MRNALTVAGSDSSGGAGLQADLKTFAALGVYGLSAVTAVTSQSTTGVSDIFTLPSQTVQSQIEQVARDAEIAAVKTGMLATAEIVRVVAETIGRFQRPNLVVDPVIAATNPGRLRQGYGEPRQSDATAGRRILLAPEAVSVLKTRLLPFASVVTPNVAEATALSGVRVDSLETAREAAKGIRDFGPDAVVITGGHMSGGQAIDLLFHAGVFTEFSAPRSSIGEVHGTGCAFASAVAAGLALGDDIPASVQRAKDYVTGAIERSLEVGQGARILNHFWGLYS